MKKHNTRPSRVPHSPLHIENERFVYSLQNGDIYEVSIRQFLEEGKDLEVLMFTVVRMLAEMNKLFMLALNKSQQVPSVDEQLKQAVGLVDRVMNNPSLRKKLTGS